LLSQIRAWLGERPADKADADPEHQRHLAAAVLLCEIARADDAYDDSEEAAIRSALARALPLSEEELDALVAASRREAADAISLHSFTRTINDTLSIADKRALMVDLWRVAYADGRLDKYEEQLLRRLADLLHLRQAEFVKAKHDAWQGPS